MANENDDPNRTQNFGTPPGAPAATTPKVVAAENSAKPAPAQAPRTQFGPPTPQRQPPARELGQPPRRQLGPVAQVPAPKPTEAQAAVAELFADPGAAPQTEFKPFKPAAASEPPKADEAQLDLSASPLLAPPRLPEAPARESGGFQPPKQEAPPIRHWGDTEPPAPIRPSWDPAKGCAVVLGVMIFVCLAIVVAIIGRRAWQNYHPTRPAAAHQTAPRTTPPTAPGPTSVPPTVTPPHAGDLVAPLAHCTPASTIGGQVVQTELAACCMPLLRRIEAANSGNHGIWVRVAGAPAPEPYGGMRVNASTRTNVCSPSQAGRVMWRE